MQRTLNRALIGLLLGVMGTAQAQTLELEQAHEQAKEFKRDIGELLYFNLRWAKALSLAKDEADLQVARSNAIERQNDSFRMIRVFGIRDQLLNELAILFKNHPLLAGESTLEGVARKFESLFARAIEERMKEDPRLYPDKYPLENGIFIPTEIYRSFMTRGYHEDIGNRSVPHIESGLFYVPALNDSTREFNRLVQEFSFWLIDQQIDFYYERAPFTVVEISPKLAAHRDSVEGILHLTSLDIREFAKTRYLREESRSKINMANWAHEQTLRERLEGNLTGLELHLTRETRRQQELFIEQNFVTAVRDQVWEIMYQNTLHSQFLTFKTKELNREWDDLKKEEERQYYAAWNPIVLKSVLDHHFPDKSEKSPTLTEIYQATVHQYLDEENKENLVKLYLGESAAGIHFEDIVPHPEEWKKLPIFQYRQKLENKWKKMKPKAKKERVVYVYEKKMPASLEQPLGKAAVRAFQNFLLELVYRYEPGIESRSKADGLFRVHFSERFYHDKMREQSEMGEGSYYHADYLKPSQPGIDTQFIRPGLQHLKTRRSYEEARTALEEGFPDWVTYGSEATDPARENRQAYFHHRTEFLTSKRGLTPLLNLGRAKLEHFFVQALPLGQYHAKGEFERFNNLVKLVARLPERLYNPEVQFDLTTQFESLEEDYLRENIKANPVMRFVANRIRYVWVRAKEIARQEEIEKIVTIRKKKLSNRVLYQNDRETELENEEDYVAYSLALIFKENPELLADNTEEEVIGLIEGTIVEFGRRWTEDGSFISSTETFNEVGKRLYKDDITRRMIYSEEGPANRESQVHVGIRAAMEAEVESCIEEWTKRFNKGEVPLCRFFTPKSLEDVKEWCRKHRIEDTSLAAIEDPEEGTPRERLYKQMGLFARFQISEFLDFSVNDLAAAQVDGFIARSSEIVKYGEHPSIPNQFFFEFKVPLDEAKAAMKEAMGPDITFHKKPFQIEGIGMTPTEVVYNEGSWRAMDFAYLPGDQIFDPKVVGRFKRERGIVDGRFGIHVTVVSEIQADQIIPYEGHPRSQEVRDRVWEMTQNFMRYEWQVQSQRNLLEFGYDLRLTFGEFLGLGTVESPVHNPRLYEKEPEHPDSLRPYGDAVRDQVARKAGNFELLKTLYMRMDTPQPLDYGVSPISDFMLERGPYRPQKKSQLTKEEEEKKLQEYAEKFTEQLFNDSGPSEPQP